MNWYPDTFRTPRRGGSAAWAIVLAGVATCSGFAMQPLEGLRVPIDFFPDGTLKHELTAQRARVMPDGSIEGTGIEFRVFTPDGNEEVTIRAADATVDRVGRSGHSESPVALMRDNLLLTGEGFEWNGVGETIRILRRVRLTFPSQMFQERMGENDADAQE